MKKIAAISMVKDECDIIELFVKINSRTFDQIFVVDHASRDGTLDILLAMKQMGYPVSISRYDHPDFQQALVLSYLARQIANTNEFSYIVPLDADEFLSVSKDELVSVLDAEIGGHGCGLLRWQNYVPVSLGFYDCEAPLYDLFRVQDDELSAHFKVVIPNEVAKGCVISEGSHFVRPSMEAPWLKGPVLSIPLQHAPVRSPEQVTAKALIGSMTLSIKKNRGRGEGKHWDELVVKLVDNGYQVPLYEMQQLVRHYGASSEAEVRIKEDAADRIGLETDRVEMRSQSRVNLTQKMHLFGQRLCSEILSLRATPAPGPQ